MAISNVNRKSKNKNAQVKIRCQKILLGSEFLFKWFLLYCEIPVQVISAVHMIDIVQREQLRGMWSSWMIQGAILNYTCNNRQHMLVHLPDFETCTASQDFIHNNFLSSQVLPQSPKLRHHQHAHQHIRQQGTVCERVHKVVSRSYFNPIQLWHRKGDTLLGAAEAEIWGVTTSLLWGG